MNLSFMSPIDNRMVMFIMDEKEPLFVHYKLNRMEVGRRQRIRDGFFWQKIRSECFCLRSAFVW